MSSIVPIRDPKKDALLTPENSALIVIDYQPLQINSVTTMRRSDIIKNTSILSQLAVDFNLPIVLSTVNVKTGVDGDTVAPIAEILEGVPSYDRTTINSWEDEEFYNAVIATGRKKLIISALWTEACLTFPVLDALREGFEVYPVVDTVGGTSQIAHEMALRRMEQAGAQLTSISQVACELQRDWNRHETVRSMARALTANGSFTRM